jgi:transglutaminase-like putative cysteine protease
MAAKKKTTMGSLLARLRGKKRSTALAEVRYAEEGTFARVVRFVRHPLRLLAMALAALAVSLGLTTTGAMASAVIGTLSGVVLGEVLGRSRYRLPLVLGGIAGVALLGFGAGVLSTTGETIPDALGPATALGLSAILRYGFIAFGVTAGLRAFAIRKPSGLALELVVVIACFAVLFAAHRDGVIARPLWLSDWAWQKGVDPAEVFLFLGGGAAVILAVLLILERKGGRTLSSLVFLPLVALFAIACLDVVGRPTPEAEDGLGLTRTEEGDPPNDQDTDNPGNGGQQGPDGGGPRPNNSGDGGAGGQTGQDGGTGGGGNRDGSAGGGGGDGGDGGGGGGGADGGRDGGGGGGRGDGGGGGGGGDGGRDGGGGGADAQFPPPPPNGGQGQGQGPSATSADLEDQQQDSQQGPPSPMAVVVLENDYSPPSGGYYFRQEAWSDFNGTRLVPSTIADADRDLLVNFPTAETAVEPPPAGMRAAVKARVALLVDHQHPFALEGPVSFRPMQNPNPERFARMYRFESLSQSSDYGALLRKTAGNPQWTEEVRAMYLEQHSDPRFLELANEIIERDLPPEMRDDPFARALAIKLYLDKELIYSTRERHANAADPTVDFLFGNRTGYCVHFAHTAVLLWRAAGIPARAGTGYMVPEENRQGGSAILIRSSDAHAWPELYLDGVGWVVLDITAERNLDQGGQPVDDDLQRLLGEMARDEPADPEDEIRDEEEEETAFDRMWTFLMTNVWEILGGIVVLILLVLYGIKAWRRIAPAFASGRQLPTVGYRAWLDRLAEVGLAREFGETREAFAERATTVAPAFGKMTALHVAAYLRPREAAERPEFDRKQWHELGASAKKELRGKTKWWRRVLGWLHPISFLDAK